MSTIVLTNKVPYVADYLRYLSEIDYCCESQYSFEELQKSFGLIMPDLEETVEASLGESNDETHVDNAWSNTKIITGDATNAPEASIPFPHIPEAPKGPTNNTATMDLMKVHTDFPHGHRTIPNSGSGLLCGFYAVIDSMKEQFPLLSASHG